MSVKVGTYALMRVNPGGSVLRIFPGVYQSALGRSWRSVATIEFYDRTMSETMGLLVDARRYLSDRARSRHA